MCYLRGLCFAKQNAFDRARDCYKDAVRIDVQCFEAFDQLMKNSLMSPAEELEFLESLDFDSISGPDPSLAQEAAHFAKMLYTTRLSKYTSPAILTDATETLSTHYNLAENPDILLSRAEALYTQCRFAEALELTSSVLSTPQSTPGSSATVIAASNLPAQNHLGHPPAVYPLHLACLYETGATNALFLLAHTLADHAPEESYTYLAIGVYYLSVSKVAEARRFSPNHLCSTRIQHRRGLASLTHLPRKGNMIKLLLHTVQLLGYSKAVTCRSCSLECSI